MARLNSILALALLCCVTVPAAAQHISPGPIMRTIAAAGGASTLNTDLIAYWKLDEASGTRADSETTGTAQDLTDNNTVTSTTGKIGNAAQFVTANSEYLSRTDSADMSVGDIGFTIAAWVYLDTLVGTGDARHVASKSGGSSDEYWISAAETGGVNKFFFVVNTAGGAKVVSHNTTLSATTWYFVVAWHDPDANTVNITFNTETPASATTSGSAPTDSNGQFQLGRYGGGSAYWNGRIDEVGFWKKVLTSDERTELYNAGSGKTCCPF
jgi:hypothetical protein